MLSGSRDSGRAVIQKRSDMLELAADIGVEFCAVPPGLIGEFYFAGLAVKDE
jgi:hypothetical protein